MNTPRYGLILASIRSAPRRFGLAATLPGLATLGILFLDRETAVGWTAPLLAFLVLTSLAAAFLLLRQPCRRRPAEWFACGTLLTLPLLATNLAIAYTGCATADQGSTGGLGWEKSKPNAGSKAEHARVTALLAPRRPETPAGLPDLTTAWNAPLWESHYTRRGARDLTALPVGLTNLLGIPFDIRGLVRVSNRPGHDGNTRRFPDRVHGIPLDVPCRRLHFLLGADWTPTNAVPVGRLTVHFTQGGPVQIPLVHGRDLLASWDGTEPGAGVTRFGSASTPNPAPTPTPTVAWQDPQTLDPTTGAPPIVRPRLFLVSWSNPHPEVPLTSLDFAAEADDLSVLFLVAITPEPWNAPAP